MTDLEALYRAVLARPEEDTPRLAYADEVEDRGDPARAELIRVQCELERRGSPAPNDERTLDLAIAEHEILLSKENRERWEPACVACGGTKVRALQNVTLSAGGERLPVRAGRVGCNPCKGTGRQPCRWERGFPVVEVSALRQVWHGVGKTRPDLQSEFVTIWEPTLWLRDTLRTHHIAGVRFTIPFPLNAATVPPQVMRHIIDNNIGRAVVLAALEWLDAQGAA